MSNHPYLLIDPFEKVIIPIYWDGTLASLYGILDCDTIDVARCGQYDIIVDGEGLMKEKQAFFTTMRYPQPLTGRALVAGVNMDGDTVPPPVTLEQVEAEIVFLRHVKAHKNRVS